MTNYLVYVDAENVSFSMFKNYYDEHLRGNKISGKVYGNSEILGESTQDYLRVGFEYVDTSHLSDSSKNVADMKIVTDCAFDVLQVFSGMQVHVVLLTKDCDFLPLVYKLMANGVVVDVPMLGKDKTMIVPMSTVTTALEEHEYDPMSSDDWILPQVSFIDNLLNGEISYEFIVRYCTRKKNRFIKSVSVRNAVLALKLDSIEISNFSAITVYQAMRRSNIDFENMMFFINMYTNKFFGKAFKPADLKRQIRKLH